ncbi:hypothetical protein JKF63_03831 [Porcisia hertigi]|uniref:Uncharacterized protein n=1 Tax=Porcisia hertigi TaxID=2761500 RepID=A0A836I3K1_9TRYP|nr:hypothetical protein JKF63_03831 [Porcisia hertigi]
MLFRSLPLHAVKVVSATLIEAMPLPDKRVPTAGSHRTLTFHLHRLRRKETFGIDCDEQCFVRGMPGDLVSSSAALQGVFGNGQLAHKSAAQVISINGVITRSKATVQELLDSGLDVIVQCNLSAVDSSVSVPVHNDDGIEERKDELREALDTPKRRQRKPKISTTELLEADTIQGVGEAPKEVKKRVRGDRGSSRKTAATGKKLLKHIGAGSAVMGESNTAVDFSTLNDGAEADTEESINAAALDKLHELAPAKPQQTRGRGLRKRRALYAVEDEKTAAEETPGDVWFADAQAARAGGGEVGEASGEKDVARIPKRRGRPRKMDSVVASVEAKRGEGPKRGRPRRAPAGSEPKKQVHSDGGHEQVHTPKNIEEMPTPQTTELDSGKASPEKDEHSIIELEF